jgi:23S rRNA A1618 N6-methylase RlmF
MIFEDGGEEGFVGQMVEESKHFQTRCKYVIAYLKKKILPISQITILITRWYTSMLGKMSSVVTIVENLRKHSVRLFFVNNLYDTFD